MFQGIPRVTKVYGREGGKGGRAHGSSCPYKSGHLQGYGRFSPPLYSAHVMESLEQPTEIRRGTSAELRRGTDTELQGAARIFRADPARIFRGRSTTELCGCFKEINT